MTNGSAPAPTGSQTQSWTSGAKDAVTTSLSSRVWATIGQGIVNEVFWPAVDQPQVKDWGFLIAGAGQWREVKAVGSYRLQPHQDPAVPVTGVTHDGDIYTLKIRVIADPGHDALLLDYDLTADPDTRLYPLLAPHLGTYSADTASDTGLDNTAWVTDGALFASAPNGRVLCLLATGGFDRCSVGYVGYSDGWTDFNTHAGMTWEYSSAGPGAVALMGELHQPSGTLALGFGRDPDTARGEATAALHGGTDSALATLTDQWQQWAATLRLPAERDGLSAELAAAVRQSATVLRCCEDRTTVGAIVAGLATPWGDATNDPGGYHMVWCRDGSETALALAVLGDLDSGAAFLQFLRQQQRPDGSWGRCYFLDGSALNGLQLDETAFPVLLASKLEELGASLPDATDSLVRAAAGYLVGNGPVHAPDAVDRWEETPGGSPFTLGLIVVALVAAAARISGDDQAYLLSLADNWNERIEEFTYVHGGLVDRAYGTAGHYVRLGPATDLVRVGNQLPPGVALRAEQMVGLEFLYLARLGLRDPHDPRFVDTLAVVDRMLARDTDSGTAYLRYDLDGYGEWLDGSGWAVRGFGIGRPWPLLAGERGHFEAMSGRSAATQLAAMLAMRGAGGLLPEQVWDGGDLPWRNLRNGKPTGSAMPLAWAHSELTKLAVTTTSGGGRPVERLAAVDARYGGIAPASTSWHWRSSVPFAALPADCDLLIEDVSPFTLHYGFDGWQQVGDRGAADLPFGMHGVLFPASELAGHDSVQFTRRWADGWEGSNYAVTLGASRPQLRALPLPARERSGRLPYD